MTASSGLTVQVEGWIERMRAGDPSAREQLINCACNRLLQLTRKLIRGFPDVHRWEQTDDVMQNASIRLYRALEKVQLNDARHFFRLAALQIRRELLDLARHYRGAESPAGRQVARKKTDGSGSDLPTVDIDGRDVSGDPRRLAEWTEFHLLIDRLPEEERETVDLLWYHGLSTEEAAGVLQVDARTIRRRWRSARFRLYELFQGEPPGGK